LGAEHYRPDHTVEKNVVTVLPGHGEAGEDHAEHEDVVQREVLLEQVGGPVGEGPIWPARYQTSPPKARETAIQNPDSHIASLSKKNGKVART
jgi:hypothetical protein